MEKEGELPIGQHVFNADLIDKTTGVVVGRTSVAVERRPPSSEETKSPEEGSARGAAPPSPKLRRRWPKPNRRPLRQNRPRRRNRAPPVATATAEGGAAPQVAAAEESGQPAKPAMRHKKHRPHVYTIRRGDTLWALAERYFGGGWHYVTIYRDNRKHIRNPNRIYPKQTVQIPKH